mmetsp:Transcript_14671/g.24527  ORF Transcript_14671/g.24527 Transcript_14671/m.24527 type:complete len:123 (+) Transcript_14671:88-456(+)
MAAFFFEVTLCNFTLNGRTSGACWDTKSDREGARLVVNIVQIMAGLAETHVDLEQSVATGKRARVERLAGLALLAACRFHLRTCTLGSSEAIPELHEALQRSFLAMPSAATTSNKQWTSLPA